MEKKTKTATTTLTAVEAANLTKASKPRVRAHLISKIQYGIRNAAEDGLTHYTAVFYGEEYSLVKNQIRPLFIKKGFKVKRGLGVSTVSLLFTWGA